MTPIRAEVLVIGLGPAGASAAAAAARNGASVLAIERKQAIGLPVQCAEFLPRPMGRYASSAAIKIQDIESMATYLPSGNRELHPLGGLMINRAAFDQALANEAQAQGAQLMRATSLVALDIRASRALIKQGGSAREVAYKVLIAADGPQSAVGKFLGLQPLATVVTRQYTVALNTTSLTTDIWLTPQCPGGYAWLFPKGGYANLGVGLHREGATRLKSILDQLHQDLTERGRVGGEIFAQTGGHIPVGGLREKLCMGKVLFVGDAAGLSHPITGAGISSAVISGEYAGLAARDYLSAHNEQVLQGYEETLRDHYAAHLRHASARREQLQAAHNSISIDALFRRSWIAFPEYYAAHAGPSITTHTMQGPAYV